MSSTSTSAPRSAARVWLALGTVYLAWGSTYVAIRAPTEDDPATARRWRALPVAGARDLPRRPSRRSARRRRAELLGRARQRLSPSGGPGFVSFAEHTFPPD